MKKNLHTNQTNKKNQHIDFHGASIISETGEEIPITEKMLDQCFRRLINAWEQSQINKRKPALGT